MEQFIGLDVSMKDTFISVREGSERVWRGKCPSDPALIAQAIRKHAPHAQRVVFETGPLSVWFYHALIQEGMPAICIDARHAKAVLDMAPNKTDANSLPRRRPGTPMAWRVWPRLAFTARFGSRASTAC